MKTSDYQRLQGLTLTEKKLKLNEVYSLSQVSRCEGEKEALGSIAFMLEQRIKEEQITVLIDQVLNKED